MTGKVCPFDKKTCIGAKCAVFREDTGLCAFLLIGTDRGRNAPRTSRTEEPSGGKFRAHLFE